MKRVNMTMLARNAKTVVADAVENPTVIITPGDKEDMILISETYFQSLKDAINQLAKISDGLLSGDSIEDVSSDHVKSKAGDAENQLDLLKG